MSGHYPVLQGQEGSEARRKGLTYPRSVPWELVKDHEEQAEKNHDQTLERLAQRGGLSPAELWCVVNDRDLCALLHGEITEDKALEWLRTLPDVAY